MHISYIITLCTKMAAMAVAKLLLCCDINIGVAVNDGGNAHAALALDSSFLYNANLQRKTILLGKVGY